MRRVPGKLEKPIMAAVHSLGYELVGMEYSSQGRRAVLRIYIDTPDGVTVDDCERVSHQVSGVLDVEDLIQGQYSLEVSSPGLDRPLFNIEQCQRYVGSQLRVRMRAPVNGRRNFKGMLQSVVEGSLHLIDDGSEFILPFLDIEQARLVPEFKQGSQDGRSGRPGRDR